MSSDPSSGGTKSHYEAHSSTSYESAFFYSPGDYMNYLRDITQECLGLSIATENRCLLDIGGGTGNFTRALVENQAHVQAIVVDPFLESQQDGTVSQQVQFVKASAENFAVPRQQSDWWRSNYQQVLMKEVIHHLDAKDRVGIFRGIYSEVQPLSNKEFPSLLIITRPQYDHDYPLWSEARKVWADNQPSLETIQQELRDAGFESVTHSMESYPCSTPLDRWLGMIQGRFWSTFSNFTDEELKEACERIQRDETKRIDKEGNIHFEDRLLFIKATKIKC